MSRPTETPQLGNQPGPLAKELKIGLPRLFPQLSEEQQRLVTLGIAAAIIVGMLVSR